MTSTEGDGGPAVTIAVAGVGPGVRGPCIAAAVAVELVQVGSLVHDDIGDEAQTLWGPRPSTRSKARTRPFRPGPT